MDSNVNDQKVLVDENAAPETPAEQERDKAAGEYKETKAHGQLSMEVRVASPFKDYYDGQAFSISAVNGTGPFDVLPKHHNFISLLLPCDMVVRTTEGVNQKIRISGGVMHVKADKVIVFLDV